MRDCLDRGRLADTDDGGGAERTAYRKGCGHGRSSGDRGGDNLYAEKDHGNDLGSGRKVQFQGSGWNGIRAVLLGRDERRCL